MSYKDPQQTGQKVSDSAMRSVKERDNIQQQNAQAPSELETNLKSVVQGGINMLQAKKNAMRKFNKAVLKEENKLYEKVGGFTTSYAGYDAKAEAFFGDLISNYSTIKTHLDNSTMKDAQLGKRDLASIKNLIDDYGKAIPKVLATAQAITEAANVAGKDGMGAANTLSVTGAPPGQLAILKKIAAGGASGEDIDLIHEGGTIILVDNKTGARLNIKEFNTAMEDKNNPYLRYVPDLSKGMTNNYNAFTKNHKEEMIDTYTKVQDGVDPNSPEAVRTMSIDQENALKSAMMGAYRMDWKSGKPSKEFRTGGGFEKMIGQYGESIWEDKMPNSLTKGLEYPMEPPMYGTPGYKEYYETYYEPMLDYLATMSINNNAVDVQRQSQNPAAWEEKYGSGTSFDKKYKGTAEEYDRKMDDFLGDEQRLSKVKPGEVITLPDGRKIRKKS